MALSINHLSEYLSQEDFRPSMVLTWRQTEETGHQPLPWKRDELPWNGLSCLSVVCYVLKFCSDSEHNDVMDTIGKLNDLACEYNNTAVSGYLADELCSLNDSKFSSSALLMMKRDSDNEQMQSWKIRQRSLLNPEKRREIAETFVNSFLPKVQQFFNFDSKRNENLAGFIHFLLLILNSESNFVQYEEIGSSYVLQHLFTVPKRNGQLTCFLHKMLNRVSHNMRYERLGSGFLQKIQIGSQIWLQGSLNFIFTVLGDIPFQLSDANNVLREIENVANEAGSLIYACFFHKCPVNVCQFSEQVVVLSRKVNLLEAKIQEHCIEISKLSIPICSDPMNTNASDTQFIMYSLLEDLQNITTNRKDLTSAMKQQTATLRRELLVAQSFLKDSNVPEVTEFQELKIQIHDTAFEAEYLLNSFVVGDFPASYFSFRLPMIIEKFERIRKVCKEIKSISGIKALTVKGNHVEFPAQKMLLASDNVIVGLEDETMQILDELTGGSGNLKCICIYGMPGLGKTTLAKRLYNHRLITDRFDECAWCVASQMYRKRNVLIEILTSLQRSMLDKEKILKMEDENLVLEVYKTLFSRRYLIVIDDVWDSRIWDDLGRYFRNSGNGSRVLFTTRIRDTAPENCIFHSLNFLSNDQCWELLEKKIFLDESCPPHLQDSGKRIAAKCNGLPLAVVAIAGALANMTSEKRIWDNVEESLGTYTSDCMKILELSFNHLPNHLRMCFLYLGVFPEDKEIPVKKLIQLWIAEGFVCKDKYKSQEHVAEEYLMDLINRSLVQVAKTRSIGGVKACIVHDLLRDMCLRISKEKNFLNLVENDSSSNEKHQRLRVLPTAPVHLRPFSLQCRSFFGHLSDPLSCLPQMKRLKVMELALCRSMSHIHIFRGIHLLHLRYLVIDQNIPLPVLANLANLEVLRVDNNSIVDVSMIISKLAKLRHLHIKYAALARNCSITKPNNLRSLSNIYMFNMDDYEGLSSLPHLKKLKCLNLPLVPDLCFLTELESLEIGVSTYLDNIKQTINFPSTVKKLNLSGAQLPWETMSVIGKLPELQSLKLYWDAFKGKEWKTSDDEFQKLMFLELGKLEVEQWITTSEHFPRLHHLVIVSCNKLWNIPSELGDIPTLHTIEVHECSYEATISAFQVEQEQRDNGNKELQVIITNRRWLKEELSLKYKQMNEEQFSCETKSTSSSSVGVETILPRKERTRVVHTGVQCDYCGTNPIVGVRYKCKDCVENIGYDLCGYCYSSSSRYKLPGRYSQMHTPEHKFEAQLLPD